MSPAPLNVLSRGWAGNDGNWSTIGLQAGTPGQGFEVLVSLNDAFVTLPSPYYCQQSNITNCGVLRGVQTPYSGFQFNISDSWTHLNDENLNVTHGLDIISLDINGSAILEVQNITIVNSSIPFLGTLGLASLPSSYSPISFTGANASNSSLLQSLKTKGTIPSLSYAYFGGAYYRNTTQSLVLGGFDSSITPNLSSPVNFAFSKTTAQSLVVKLASISLGDGLDAPTPLLATPIDAVLDTSYPYFDLPQAACDMFAASFGLIQNNATGLFSVNSSLYTKLQDSNPSIIFTLKKDVSSKTAINISLPYASFDLVGNEPFAADATRYFPIRVAKNESQAILGRAFFQEAYIVADYERQNFSLYQAQHVLPNQTPVLTPIEAVKAVKGALWVGILFLIFVFCVIVIGSIGARKNHRTVKRNKQLEAIWEEIHRPPYRPTQVAQVQEIDLGDDVIRESQPLVVGWAR